MLTTCFVVSIVVRKAHHSLRIFPYLLGLSLIAETIVDIRYHLLHEEYNIVYHIYIPIEYMILSIYFISLKGQLRHIILMTIPIFMIGSYWYSFSSGAFHNDPGPIFNIEGLLLITWSLTTLFLTPPIYDVPLTRLPQFWICMGLIVFHSGIFFFNGVYQYLQTVDSELADQLHLWIMRSFNYMLYILFDIGFLCSHKMKL